MCTMMPSSSPFSTCSSSLPSTMIRTRFFFIYTTIFCIPVICFRPTGSRNQNRSLPRGLVTRVRGFPINDASPLVHRADNKFNEESTIFLKDGCYSRERSNSGHCNRRHFVLCIAVIHLVAFTLGSRPSPSFALTNSISQDIPTLSDMKTSLVSILDSLSHSGTMGMVVYAFSFLLWTMTVGVTTPIETAAGMAFPLQRSIPLSAIGKIGGAFFQYVFAKYLFSDYAREKLKDNEWIEKINLSFQSNPYKVALIWRFSPLPEFVKNIGPALVPTLKTRYQIFATLTHGLPFTVLWSCIGNEAAIVARGGHASLFLKRLVGVISWVGLVVSPTLFGWWIKGLSKSNDEVPSKLV